MEKDDQPRKQKFLERTETIKKILKTNKHRQKHQIKGENVYSVPGIFRIFLSESVQNFIECVVGEQVTSENPWIYVKKELILDDLELHDDNSEFISVKQEIIQYSNPEILVGHIPQEKREYDEFYICLTENASNFIVGMLQKERREAEIRLHNSIYRHPRPWPNQGANSEVDECTIKNFRPLIQVEIETKYPILSNKVQFRFRKAEDVYDGYLELRSVPDSAPVIKKRIDNFVQVAPSFVSDQAQTICTYPTNSGTQYNYEYDVENYEFTTFQEKFVNFTNENLDSLSDLLNVNGCINFYTDDYNNLVFKGLPSSSDEKPNTIISSFMDVHLCKGKTVAYALWHPMWSDVVAISYSDQAPNQCYTSKNTSDEVYRAVYETNIVLIWSLTNSLKPKLVLEAPREVLCLSFCDYDENILVGGCQNGQIVIWDLRNKLKLIDHCETLTSVQRKHKNYMNTLLGWIKIDYCLNIVRPTVLSDIKYSHKGPVVQIKWSSPYYEFTEAGTFIKIPDEREYMAMQFVSSSEDGTILIWDLLKKPNFSGLGDFKRTRILKRLKQLPFSAEQDISPFKSLHLNLKPIYKVTVKYNENLNHPLGCMDINSCRLQYKIKSKSLDRVIYRPVFNRPTAVLMPKIEVGTLHGDYVYLRWLEHNLEADEMIEPDIRQFSDFAKFHNGPVISLSLQSDICLTIGGKILAIWSEDFKGGPVIWRRSLITFTHGKWIDHQPFTFTAVREDGNLELWVIHYNSKSLIFSTAASSCCITSISIQYSHKEPIMAGYGDDRGIFRVYNTLQVMKKTDEMDTAVISDFIKREIERKKQVAVWQQEWQSKHRIVTRLKHSLASGGFKKFTNMETLRRETAKRKLFSAGAQVHRSIEKHKEKHIQDELERMHAIILHKKQFDTEEIEKRRKPLQILEDERQRLKRKRKRIIQQGNTIFQETVENLFPDIVKEKSLSRPDQYSESNELTEQEKIYNRYLDLTNESKKCISNNPYKLVFSWKNVLISSRKRRIDVIEQISHWKRRNMIQNKITK